MAFDAFLRIEGIPGESRDDVHTDWIEILSYSHGVSQAPSGSVSSAGGATSQRCDHDPFVISKELDKASAKLAEHACTGKHIPEVVLTLCRAGGDKVEYMRYTLRDAIVSSFRPSGSKSGASSLPNEEVEFTYGKIEWEYTQQKRSDGTGGGKVAAGWDLELNKKI